MSRNILSLGVLILCLLVTVQFADAQIRNSKHDLSSSSSSTGPGSTDLDQVCVFCHTPHSQSATTVLWNRTEGTGYTSYSSPSMEQTISGPGSVSKNCLSCHDGVVAFNSLINSPGSGTGTAPTVSPATMTGWDSLGVDLTNDHPVGMAYATSQATDGYLRLQTTVGVKHGVTNIDGTDTNRVPLYGTTLATATVECGSCHDPHVTGNGTFLRMANTKSALCFTCHNK